MTDRPTDASADRLMLLLDLAAVALHDGDDELAVARQCNTLWLVKKGAS